MENPFNTMKEYQDFLRWEIQIVYKKDNVILPNGETFDKTPWVKSDGFNSDGFRKTLVQIYKNQ